MKQHEKIARRIKAAICAMDYNRAEMVYNGAVVQCGRLDIIGPAIFERRPYAWFYATTAKMEAIARMHWLNQQPED